MKTEIRSRRREVGISLDELAAALGPGFSRARLSIAERGLIELPRLEEELVLVAIERLGSLRGQVRRVIETAQSLDLVSFCKDIRDEATSLRT
jgi:hypothetical protein